MLKFEKCTQNDQKWQIFSIILNYFTLFDSWKTIWFVAKKNCTFRFGQNGLSNTWQMPKYFRIIVSHQIIGPSWTTESFWLLKSNFRNRIAQLGSLYVFLWHQLAKIYKLKCTYFNCMKVHKINLTFRFVNCEHGCLLYASVWLTRYKIKIMSENYRPLLIIVNNVEYRLILIQNSPI